MERTATRETSALFAAFREAPRGRRSPWLWAALAGIALSIGGVLLVALTEDRIAVVTQFGVRSLHHGMAPDEVSGLLGRPVSEETVDGRTCLRYAQPVRKAETVAVYTVCYRDGKLVDVSEKPFGLWRVAKDGTIRPMVERRWQTPDPPNGPVPPMSPPPAAPATAPTPTPAP
jgi:hypothetical protein